MPRPEFPREFEMHVCPNTLEARHWRKQHNTRYGREDGTDADDAEYAACAFHKAGIGLECETCNLFMTRPFLDHERDTRWLPRIEQYYRDLGAYEEREEDRRLMEQQEQFDYQI